MEFDIVVFTQKELSAAVLHGVLNIALCDNDFILPIKENLRYIAIGNVKAEIPIGKEKALELGMAFEGFTPVFIPGAFAPLKDEHCKIQGYSSYMSSYVSSYASSYTSPYASSYIGSYHYHEYEFEYGSFSASYLGSYLSSYSGSYVSSYSDPYGHIINPFILVNGYGIDLI